MKKILAILCSVYLISCSTTYVQISDDIPIQQSEYQSVSLNQEHTVSVGENILELRRGSYLPIYEASKSFNAPLDFMWRLPVIQQGDLFPVKNKIIDTSATGYLIRNDDIMSDYSSEYISIKDNGYIWHGFVKRNLMVSKDQGDWQDEQLFQLSKQIEPKADYYELRLVLTSTTNDKITIKAHEQNYNELNQYDLEYDIQDNNIIEYKNIHIEIIGIKDNKATYKLLKLE